MKVNWEVLILLKNIKIHVALKIYMNDIAYDAIFFPAPSLYPSEGNEIVFRRKCLFSACTLTYVALQSLIKCNKEIIGIYFTPQLVLV